jgi:hypothetical protein
MKTARARADVVAPALGMFVPVAFSSAPNGFVDFSAAPQLVLLWIALVGQGCQFGVVARCFVQKTQKIVH